MLKAAILKPARSLTKKYYMYCNACMIASQFVIQTTVSTVNIPIKVPLYFKHLQEHTVILSVLTINTLWLNFSEQF